MGPTNISLLKLYRADQELRAAQARLDSAARSVRVHERRIGEMSERLRLLQSQLREQQARAAQMELEIKSHDERIEKFRQQQQNSKNLKEYQTFLTEINTQKIDKGKIEDELIKVMEAVEKLQPEIKTLSAQAETEQKSCDQTRQQLAGKLAELQAEVDRARIKREEATTSVPPSAVDAFERIAERWDGEAMAGISKPDRRREEYVCTACNMSLVADIYNRLHSRDELVFCPNCHRLLYIPEDLTPELALNKPRERRDRREKVAAAAVGRQTSAADVSRSITPEEDQPQNPPAQQGQSN